MASDIASGWARDWAVPPGEILEEALEERRMSQAELARRMNRPLKTINEIIKGKAAITSETALQLELAVGINARFWNNLERNFREHQARTSSRAALETDAAWANRFPLQALRKHNLIGPGRGRAETLESLLRFFRLTSPAAWERQWQPISALFRGAGRKSATTEALTAWLRWGEVLAEKTVQTEPYSPEAFRLALTQTRAMVRQDLTLIFEQLQELWGKAGVVLVGVPEIPHAPLSGAARWLYSDRPLVQISLRYGTDDQIWFSIFHEADHVLEHSRRLVFIDTGYDDTDEMEAHANAFARDWLVPSDPYEAFVAAGKFDPDAVRVIAKQMELPPGIVVGLLQHDGHIPPSRLNSLKRPVRWTNQ
jgi:addiction module HigA family antidote